MQLIDDYRLAQLREAERRRFQRWFVPSPLGWAYIDRAGRARGVRDDEFRAWQAAAFLRIEEMLADLPTKAVWTVAALIIIIFGGNIALGALGIDGTARHLSIGIAVVVVEAGLIGIDLYDYWRGWQVQRNAIEAAVVGRAPLPVDPERSRIPRNVFLIAQYVIAGGIMLLYFSSHIDSRLIEWIDWRWGVLLIPIAWGLHFAERRQDEAAQNRLRDR